MDVRDHKEGWPLKNWCFWAVVLERTLESPMDCKKIKSVNPKGNQFLILIGRTDTEAPILWPLHVKSQLIRKDSCWERLNTGEGGDRGWDGWMASLTQWTCVWASSRRWWRIDKPGILQSVGSRRVRHNWATEQQQQHVLLLHMWMLQKCEMLYKCESYTKSISRPQMVHWVV